MTARIYKVPFSSLICAANAVKATPAGFRGVLVAVVAAVMLFGVPFAPSMHASVSQQNRAAGQTASVSGHVTNKTGVPLGGVVITIEHLVSHAKQSVTSDASGAFQFKDLPSGVYKMEASRDGFKLFVVHSMPLVPGDTARSTIRMEAGSVTETVEGGAESIVSKAGTSLAGKDLNDIPENQRNFVNIMQLQAGANEGTSNTSTSGSVPGAQHTSTSVSVGGQLEYFNNITIDGIFDNLHGSPGIALNPSVEGIGGAILQYSAYPASSGSALGGSIALGTKSGTRRFHGTLFEYFRNDVLDAYPYLFGLQVRKPTVRQNQFGGSASGPIKKDKIFYFADFESFRLIQAKESELYDVPSLAQRQNPNGLVSYAIPAIFQMPAGTGLTVAQMGGADPAGLAYFKLYPAPNVGTNTYLPTNNDYNFSDSVDGRVDDKLSKNDQLFVRFSLNKSNVGIPDVFPAVQAGGVTVSPAGSYTSGFSKSTGVLTGISYTHHFKSNGILILRAGYEYGDQPRVGVNGNAAVATALGIPGINSPYLPLANTGMPNAIVAGASPLGASSYATPGIAAQSAFDYMGAYTKTLKNHTFTVGAEVVRQHDKTTAMSFNAGMFYFEDYASLVAGLSVSTARATFVRIPQYRDWLANGYFSDQWNAIPHLTLTYGLRWDLFTPPTEASNHFSNFDIATGQYLVAGQNEVSSTVNVVADKKGFGPRFGFNYSPDNKTSIHGGFGMVYFYPSDQNNFTGAPNVTSFGSCMFLTCALSGVTPNSTIFGIPDTTMSAGIVPYSPQTPPSTTVPAGSITGARPVNLPLQYIEQFNLGVDRDITAHDKLSISYVGALGRQISRQFPDVNEPLPTTDQNINPDRPLYGIDPNLTTVGYLDGGGASSYDAAQVSYTHVTHKGLSANYNYTFAHGLDNACPFYCTNLNDGFGMEVAKTSTIDKGNSMMDIRSHMSSTIAYELPYGKSATGSKALLEKGWVANLVGVWQTGMPFTVYDPTNASGVNPGQPDRPNVVGKVTVSNPSVTHFFNANAFQEQTPGTLGNERRYQYHGPHVRHVDVSLFKNVRVHEKTTVQFRTEVFNLTNTGDFGGPDNRLGDQSFGQLTTLTSGYTPRLVQFAVRIQY
jgi:hypothetical protein